MSKSLWVSTVSGGPIFQSTNVEFAVKGGVADVVEGDTAIIIMVFVATTATNTMTEHYHHNNYEQSSRIFISNVKGRLPGRLMTVSQNRNGLNGIWSIADWCITFAGRWQEFNIQNNQNIKIWFRSSYFDLICSLIQDLTTRTLTAYCVRRHDPSQPARKICVQKMMAVTKHGAFPDIMLH